MAILVLLQPSDRGPPQDKGSKFSFGPALISTANTCRPSQDYHHNSFVHRSRINWDLPYATWRFTSIEQLRLSECTK